MYKYTFKNLIEKHSTSKYIPYQELLDTKEWYDKRNIILKRDFHKCQNCGEEETIKLVETVNNKEEILFIKDTPEGTRYFNKQYILHVHHKYYIRNKPPWEYDNNILITLCNWCHEDLHKKEVIKVYDEHHKEITNLTPCERCSGKGWFPHYDHIQSGICFYCKGAKFMELINFKIK